MHISTAPWQIPEGLSSAQSISSNMMETKDDRLVPFPFLVYHLAYRKGEPKVDDTAPFSDVERRKIVGDMIAAGAFDSEYGAQMFMSVFPDRF